MYECYTVLLILHYNIHITLKLLYTYTYLIIYIFIYLLLIINSAYYAAKHNQSHGFDGSHTLSFQNDFLGKIIE